MASHDPRHIWAVVDLTQAFVRPDNSIVSVHNPLRLDDCCEPAPDIVLFHTDVPQDRMPTPEHALLLVEVAGRSLAIDQKVKAPRYAHAGVPEYWIVDLRGERVELHREASDAGYRASRFYLRGESVSPAFAPDMAIEVDAILGSADIEYDDEA